MELLGRILALVLAAVFLWAAFGKLRDRPSTASQFRDLGLPRPAETVVVVAIAEIAVAGLLLVVPPWGAIAAFVLLIGFTTLLAGVVRSGRPVHCACFGALTDSPVSWRSLVRNAVLLVATLPVMVLDGW